MLQYVELFLRRPPRINAEFVLAKRTKAAAASLSLVSNETVLDATWFDDAAIPAKRMQLERLVQDPRVVSLHAAPMADMMLNASSPAPPTSVAQDVVSAHDDVAPAGPATIEEDASMTLLGESSESDDVRMDAANPKHANEDATMEVPESDDVASDVDDNVHQTQAEMSVEPRPVWPKTLAPAAATVGR